MATDAMIVAGLQTAKPTCQVDFRCATTGARRGNKGAGGITAMRANVEAGPTVEVARALRIGWRAISLSASDDGQERSCNEHAITPTHDATPSINNPAS